MFVLISMVITLSVNVPLYEMQIQTLVRLILAVYVIIFGFSPKGSKTLFTELANNFLKDPVDQN